jgi:hypothetical protein
MPLHGWSTRRRAAVAGAIAAAGCALGTGASIRTDFVGASAAETALAAARRELADAQRAQRVLPGLKQAAATTPRGPRRSGNSADDARVVSELAAASGISLVSLEPGASGGQGAAAHRVLKLAAQGDFAQLRAFLHRLVHASVLIVPTEASIRRNGSSLSLAATVSVFDALPSLPVAASGGDAAILPDPFATDRSDGASTVDGLRLVGLLQDRTHAVALIETPRGIDAVEQGDRVEGERVARIAMKEVTLITGSTTRVLKWTDDGR